MEKEQARERKRQKRSLHAMCMGVSAFCQDTYMRMALIGSLISCSGTKKGSGMENMELNKEKCGWTWSTGFQKPLITHLFGMSDFHQWSFWVECFNYDICTRWICLKGMQVSQMINQALYCNTNHNSETLMHWDVSEDEEMVLWSWMTVCFTQPQAKWYNEKSFTIMVSFEIEDIVHL